MAKALPDPALSKSKFHNWIKAALAILFTKEEIEPVVYNEILQFQQKCLQDIAASNGLALGSTCNICCTENVIECPTNRLCNVRRRQCSYHRNAATQYRASDCPNSICHNLKSYIQKAHRYYGPSYKNTDTRQWCSNPWEIAKCFMPPDGYKDVKTAKETDFNGINSVIINHKEFDAKISDDLSKKNNIFQQGRDVCRAVRHSANLEVEDADLSKYFMILNNILNDTGFKAINTSPKNAGQKLAKLQNEELVIEKDVLCKLLDDVGEAIHEKINDDISEYKQVAEERKIAMLDIFEEKMKAIETKGTFSVAKLSETLKSSIDDLKDLVQESVTEIQNQVRKGKEEINREKERALKEIASKEYGGNSTNSLTQDMYQKQKQKLKIHLMKFYKNKQSTVPLSPLVEEERTKLAGFYVMPDMVSVKKSPSSEQEERTTVISLTDLFVTGSEDQQEIYLSADAGFGKTSLSKYLAVLWCHAFCPDRKKECFKDEEIKALSNFELVFLVLLRDCYGVCYIDEMIEQQIMKKLPPSAAQCPLQEILNREKCLIILDGLDEWTHPDNGCSDQHEKVPHRYARDNCVILTTTRPWKLGVSNLKTSDVNKKVELLPLSDESIRQMLKNAIRKMSGVKNDDELVEKTRELSRVIEDCGLKHLQKIPLLLIYITCLWCNNIPIGNSVLDVYIKIIEFLLLRTTQKHPEVQTLYEHSLDDIPEFLKNHANCRKFFFVLTKLAKLAYYTLFNEKRENTLVFDGSVAEMYLTANDMKLCLLSGILTESTTTTLVERKSKVSFSHKTVQEFFAAIVISSQNGGQETVLKKFKTVQSILDASMICEFLSKLNSKIMFEIMPVFMTVINEDEKTRNYRAGPGDMHINSEPLYNIQKMLLSCLKEMPERENFKLLFQDFFINSHTIHDKNLQRLLKQNQTEIKSLYINMHDTSSSLLEVVESFSVTCLNNLQKLYYYGRWQKSDISLLLFPRLQSVTLSSIRLTNEERFCEKFTALQNVKYLYVSGPMLSHKTLEIFFSSISSKQTIETLQLWMISCKEHEGNCVTKVDLSKLSQLKYLVFYELPSIQLNLTSQSLADVKLFDIKFDKKSLLLSRDVLNINRVLLHEIKMSAESLREFIEVVEKLPQSVKIHMYKIEPEIEYERVRNYVTSSQSFVVTRAEEYSWKLGKYFDFQTRKSSQQ